MSDFCFTSILIFVNVYRVGGAAFEMMEIVRAKNLTSREAARVLPTQRYASGFRLNFMQIIFSNWRRSPAGSSPVEWRAARFVAGEEASKRKSWAEFF